MLSVFSLDGSRLPRRTYDNFCSYVFRGKRLPFYQKFYQTAIFFKRKASKPSQPHHIAHNAPHNEQGDVKANGNVALKNAL